MINVLSKLQCGFRKRFGAHNCLLYMIETIVKTRDNRGVKVIISYLKNRTQTKKKADRLQ